MTDLQARLDAAKAEVVRLEREARQATCIELGHHDWQSFGGCNAGCEWGERDRSRGTYCSCSVPVNICTRCGDCDYGENAEAHEVRRQCAEANLAFIGDRR